MNRQIQKIASEEAIRHGDDIDAAERAAFARVRRLSAFEELVNDMIRTAIRSIIQGCRCTANEVIRRKARTPSGPAKVKPGAATDAVAEACYNYFIDGRTLGSILGKELAGIAKSEAARAKGHQTNAELALRLDPIVPKDKTVRQAVKAAKLRSIFAGLEKGKA